MFTPLMLASVWQIVIATTTLALGVNMPAKSTVFLGFSSYLDQSTFHQCGESRLPASCNFKDSRAFSARLDSRGSVYYRRVLFLSVALGIHSGRLDSRHHSAGTQGAGSFRP